MLLRLIIAVMFLPAQTVQARLLNTPTQNEAQYGTAIETITHPSAITGSFTGYKTYSMNDKWKVKAYFRNGTSRIEHLTPKVNSDTQSHYSRSEVRSWAAKMFAPAQRGVYHKKIQRHLVQGHFFDRGLIAYEHLIKNRQTIGYNGVKVLLYENNQRYRKINPKAYL